MSLIDVARSNWRAELNDLAAEEVRDTDPAKAAEHERIAEHEREYASLMTELSDAKTLGDPEYLINVKLRVSAFRRNARQGAYPQPGILNNFQEPSNSDLIGD